MNRTEWNVAAHVAIPSTYPHETPDLELLNSGQVWKLPGKPLMCRWTSDFDLHTETNFWACIQDTVFDLDSVKAKRRYEIKKGNKFFLTKPVKADELDAMYDVYVESLEGYATRGPVQSLESFSASWKYVFETPDVTIMGAYDREDGRLCGWAHLIKHGCYIPISSFKTRVSCERHNVNFALMYGICTYFSENIRNGAYLCDGFRNVAHKTAFQDFLEKYFGFRKAYCFLHIAYRPGISTLVKLMYPMRNFFHKHKTNSLCYKASAVMKMEEIVRMDKVHEDSCIK